MDLNKNKGRGSEVVLKNGYEADLFVDDGLGMFSIKGIRLARTASKAQAAGQWPISVNISDRRLKSVADRMNGEAARLSVMATMAGFGEYPQAAENELMLRDMAAMIDNYLELVANNDPFSHSLLSQYKSPPDSNPW